MTIWYKTTFLFFSLKSYYIYIYYQRGEIDKRNNAFAIKLFSRRLNITKKLSPLLIDIRM